MDTISEFFGGWFQAEQIWSLIRALLIVVGGWIVARLLSSWVDRLTRATLDVHRRMLLRRGAYYGIWALFIISALMEIGLDLGILLGTAGVVTVAIAFASQTSASNFISGLFLIAESPFQIGDIIQVGSTTGEVIEIDLLSVKLRKFDNSFVRLPNELLIKSEVINLTKFPIRRLDMQIGVDYSEDMSTVRDVLFQVAANNPLCLVEPPPLFIFQGFGESAQNIQFSVWVFRENYLAVKNSIQEEIHEAFVAQHITIPFPQRTLTFAPGTGPFPVQVVPFGEETAESQS